jgi:hypothetical protein
MKKLTIGLSVFDDYNGAYFTIQAIRMYHPEVLDNIEFVIINNNPTSAEGKALKTLATNWIKEPVQYIEFTDYSSTIVRDKIFEYARTPYVMSVDSHVFIVPGALQKLINFYDSQADGGNLLQGPLLYDDLKSISTEFRLEWRENMWGIWFTDPRGEISTNEPFEIEAQGLGLFTCRKSVWPGFNRSFRGFGGEEGYIHHKFKKIGKKTLCLPFLRWMHRFNRPHGIPYPISLNDRFRNYLIGFTELGLNTDEVFEHFKSKISPEYIQIVKEELKL